MYVGRGGGRPIIQQFIIYLQRTSGVGPNAAAGDKIRPCGRGAKLSRYMIRTMQIWWKSCAGNLLAILN
jgi:hypothetical protein